MKCLLGYVFGNGFAIANSFSVVFTSPLHDGKSITLNKQLANKIRFILISFILLL